MVVVATTEHLLILSDRLGLEGFDVANLILETSYIPIDVEEALQAFMVNSWPDAQLFKTFISSILERAQASARKVRVFGEIVAVLWARGNSGATVRLEHLWHEFQQQQKFCLYCAYPKSGFTQKAQQSITILCNAHSRIISGAMLSPTEIYYQ